MASILVPESSICHRGSLAVERDPRYRGRPLALSKGSTMTGGGNRDSSPASWMLLSGQVWRSRKGDRCAARSALRHQATTQSGCPLRTRNRSPRGTWFTCLLLRGTAQLASRLERVESPKYGGLLPFQPIDVLCIQIVAPGTLVASVRPNVICLFRDGNVNCAPRGEPLALSVARAVWERRRGPSWRAREGCCE